MKIRLILAVMFTLSLGTSIYYTEKAQAAPSQLRESCCSGDPQIVIVPMPIPTPTPTTK
jgi:hypothetical protein